jgi:hypothetical protein
VLANAGTFHNRNIAADMCALAYLHILVDGYERIDDHARMDIGGGVNIRKWLFHVSEKTL